MCLVGGLRIGVNAGVGDAVELSLTQVGDDLLLTADGIHTTLLDVDKDALLAADVVDFI